MACRKGLDLLFHFRRHRLEQAGVVFGAAAVPRFHRQEAVVLPLKNFALNEDQVIGLHRHPGPAQGLHQAGHVAPRVDDPVTAAGLECSDALLQCVRDFWITEIVVDGAVEVGRQHPERGTKAHAWVETGVASAIGQGQVRRMAGKAGTQISKRSPLVSTLPSGTASKGQPIEGGLDVLSLRSKFPGPQLWPRFKKVTSECALIYVQPPGSV